MTNIANAGTDLWLEFINETKWREFYLNYSK